MPTFPQKTSTSVKGRPCSTTRRGQRSWIRRARRQRKAKPTSKGRSSPARTTASSSIGVSSPAKKLVLRRDASLLLYVQEQIKETSKVLMGLRTERMKKDAEILTSIQGIGETTALNFLVEI